MAADAELLFCNGTVFDGHRFLPPGTAVRVRDGRVTRLEAEPGRPGGHAGNGQVATSPAGLATIVDLAGGTLLPGFIDAHVHPVFAGDQLRRCDLSGALTQREYLEIIGRYAGEHPDTEWITGGGWSMEAFPAGVPTAAPLDAVVADRPVCLRNRDGHGVWVNTRALQLAGIDEATPDPADGRIERDERGRPVGMLQEGAAGLVSRLIPAATDDDWDEGLRAAQAYLVSLGITGWQDAIIGDRPGAGDPMAAYLRAARAGTLKVTVVGALWWSRERGLDQLADLIERRGEAQRECPERFRATTVKMMLDGVAENHTAAMLEPYLDGHGCSTDVSGLDFIDPGLLPGYVTELDHAGFQVHFHALGDRAVRNALDAVGAARRASGSTGQRHHLAHLQVVHPDDIRRFAEIQATANIQALWAAHEPQMDELTIPFLGERRAGWQYPFRSLAEAGANLCAGSDWPVSSPDPLWAAHVAVNRAVPSSARASSAGGSGAESREPFLPEERLDLRTFLAAYTSGSARINGVEASAGAIEPGLDADFAVVDADLRHVSRHEIGQATVTQTWIRGELVYQQGH
ncbi:MAG TPA: amidohydrolase [Streptosporangiaceae bacterium]|nr:amidohydrolase [Streptosporangiaceae bacterium]